MTKPLLIAIYNFKGGVGKTTATYNIGYILSNILGLKVLMVDADPQCNLTGLIHAKDFIDIKESVNYYLKAEQKAKHNPPKLTTMGQIFGPIIKDEQPKSLELAQYVELTQVHEYKSLFFIPGHLSTSEIDSQIALGVSGIAFYKNLPGYITNLFRKIGERNNIDVILFDLSPSFGVFNGYVVIGSDYFLIPFSADFFSLQAMQSLQQQIPKWYKIIHEYDNKWDEFGKITTKPKFLGAYPQKVRTRQSEGRTRVEQAYGSWITRIYDESEKLAEALKENNMCTENFQFNKVVGIIDLISVGLDVQVSGRPISDVAFVHKHQKSATKQSQLTGAQIKKKKEAFTSYRNVVGALFANLTQEDSSLLSDRQNTFQEKLALYSNLYIDVDANPYICVPQTPQLPEEDQHWYTNDEIDSLLSYYFGDNANVYCHRSVSPKYLNELKTAFNKIHKMQNRKQKILLPVNIDNNHWALLYIHYLNNAETPTICFFDPLGSSITEHARIEKGITNVYGDIEILSLEQRVQEDGYNCGPWIIESAQTLINQGGLPPADYNINACRNNHNEILQDDSFELNQYAKARKIGTGNKLKLAPKHQTDREDNRSRKTSSFSSFSFFTFESENSQDNSPSQQNINNIVKKEYKK